MKNRSACKLALLLTTLAIAAPARGGEVSLLTPEGTVWEIRSGRAVDLGVSGQGISPLDQVIDWAWRRQDGSRAIGLLRGAVNANAKQDLGALYDEPTDSLILFWKEESPAADRLHLAISQRGQWTLTDLVPSMGATRVRNAQALISHDKVLYVPESGRDQWLARSTLHLIWLEELPSSRIRYASLFLDPGWSAADLQLHDLPSTEGQLAGGPFGIASAPAATLHPSLQLEGIEGDVLASYPDLRAGRHRVVRIRYPRDLGQINPFRRHQPIVFAMAETPPPLPAAAAGNAPVKTVIGPSYRPTLHWRGQASISYTRFDGESWSSVRSIPLVESMSAERAIRLIEEMAAKN